MLPFLHHCLALPPRTYVRKVEKPFFSSDFQQPQRVMALSQNKSHERSNHYSVPAAATPILCEGKNTFLNGHFGPPSLGVAVREVQASHNNAQCAGKICNNPFSGIVSRAKGIWHLHFHWRLPTRSCCDWFDGSRRVRSVFLAKV